MPSTTTPTLTIVGLGPGAWENLTVGAANLLEGSSDVYLRTAADPTLAALRARLPKVRFHGFDHLCETFSDRAAIDRGITEELMRLAASAGQVVYAVPGSPSRGEPVVRMLQDRGRETKTVVRLVPGMSVVEPVLAAAGLSDPSWAQIIDAAEIALYARENAVGEVADADTPLPWRAPTPTAPLLVPSLRNRETASAVQSWLRRYYPDEHRVQVIRAPGSADEEVLALSLRELDGLPEIDCRTALFLPGLPDIDNVRTFAGMMQLTRRLRGPGGCPWDREQTNASLKPYLLEETYEVLDALDSGDPAQIAEEFGDLLYQVTIHAQVGAEDGAFTIEDIIQNIMVKLIGRHPHVFGDLQLESAQDVRQVWEVLKQRQKPKRTSVLQEIPRGLPALPQSNLMQKRAASVGFAWPDLAAVVDKVAEELEELRREVDETGPGNGQREELGDILFALVGVARQLRIDPEEALRQANHKFAARFAYVEARAKDAGQSIRDMDREPLAALWQEAKAKTARDA